ncbi:PH domain-containing protein [Oligoflexia bacterium]|nr:PH domain-containing protein [Oligoflexia bacterium]
MTIRPAKRVIIFYLLVFLSFSGALMPGLEYLRIETGIEVSTIRLAWKAWILIGAGLVGYAFLRRLNSVYLISDECVRATVGILSQKRIRIALGRIVDYRVNTPLIERILGLESIHIGTAGDDELVMRGISQVEGKLIVRKLDELLKEEHRKSEKPKRAINS